MQSSVQILLLHVDSLLGYPEHQTGAIHCYKA